MENFSVFQTGKRIRGSRERRGPEPSLGGLEAPIDPLPGSVLRARVPFVHFSPAPTFARIVRGGRPNDSLRAVAAAAGGGADAARDREAVAVSAPRSPRPSVFCLADGGPSSDATGARFSSAVPGIHSDELKSPERSQAQATTLAAIAGRLGLPVAPTRDLRSSPPELPLPSSQRTALRAAACCTALSVESVERWEEQQPGHSSGPWAQLVAQTATRTSYERGLSEERGKGRLRSEAHKERALPTSASSRCPKLVRDWGGQTPNRRQATLARRKKGKLSEERAKKLEDLGFDWGTTRGTPLPWDERFDELKEYKGKYGHCNVPRSQGSLGRWVDNQRKAREEATCPRSASKNLTILASTGAL
ncbi:hypothetical protein THAOC_35812 [Thalassiosira oceanica]|uniref:Helicase-associated domain-containing protein n=1 Tax=Thalassiosira oceanica TaxID=159749 RepID=K0RG52_THAOC|nr:hypothetical protein THAOC_35812 [Thalassiosira oceanica]|eukprot:EJK45567.1 hypothetical protein THAOC_35812 [Thalassiosira oceanica]